MSMIPQKSAFKFAELTGITGVKPYVLRFWETEFPEISPIDGEDGQKVYSRSDVETIIRIKDLLFERKLSLQEAKFALQDPNWVKRSTETITVVAGDQEAAVDSLTAALTFIKSLKHKYHW